MINRVTLTGRLTSDIELRQTSDGTPFTYFTVAVNRQSNRETTDFIPCVAWRAQAELLKNYVNKGSLIGVEGRMEVFTTQQDGQYNTRINVNVSQIHFLEPRRNNNQGMNDSHRTSNTNYESELSFEKEEKVNYNSNQQNSFESNSETNEIDFDNIKF